MKGKRHSGITIIFLVEIICNAWLSRVRVQCLMSFFLWDHGVGSTDHFSALKIWMFENKFVSLPSHLKTIEPMARPIREKSGTGVYHDLLTF